MANAAAAAALLPPWPWVERCSPLALAVAAALRMGLQSPSLAARAAMLGHPLPVARQLVARLIRLVGRVPLSSAVAKAVFVTAFTTLPVAGL